MAGTGKYTTYAPPASDKNTLMNKLYRSDDAAQQPIVQDLVGKENEAREAIVALGRSYLQPAHQQGDLGHFPTGVNLNYSDAPDVTEVAWENAGDPANPYTPDISSPGPGKTAGTDKDQDPDLSTTDLKPNYVPGAPNTGTKSPSATNSKIIAANALGVPGVVGDSGANT